jgi:hypothetical protein
MMTNNVKQLQFLDKIVPLGADRDPSTIDNDTFLSLMRDLDPNVASDLEGTAFSLRVVGITLVAYRTGAQMG